VIPAAKTERYSAQQHQKQSTEIAAKLEAVLSHIQFCFGVEKQSNHRRGG
jgi:hypothetical protein